MRKSRIATRFKIINNTKEVHEIIDKINTSKDISEISLLVSELDKYIENYPKCVVCGKPIYFQEMFLSIKGNYVLLYKPSILEHIYENNVFKLCHCYDCIKNHFKDDMPSMQRYLFQLRYRWAKFAYNIPENIHQQIRSDMCAVTLKSCIRKHGQEKGEAVYKEYCRKQAETNTFEYKQKKYGWTKEQFKEFNKSRAVTFENLIKRHGQEKGQEIWDNYVTKQKLTKSWEYMVEKFGEDKAYQINQSKALTIDNLIKKYGEIEGEQRYYEWIDKVQSNSSTKYYSNISQKLFQELDELLPQYKEESKYFVKNKEQIIKYEDENGETHTYFLDYYIPSLNVCVEFNGDMWHANPKKYKDKNQILFNNLSVKDIQNNDKKRIKKLKEQNIRVIVVWESEYRSKDFNIKNLIKKILK